VGSNNAKAKAKEQVREEKNKLDKRNYDKAYKLTSTN